MAGGARKSLPESTAPRLRTPSWRDPRLLFGILLVAGSVVLGSWAVNAGQRTVGIYQVTETITPGVELSADNLAVVQIRSSDVQDRYLMASDSLPEGQITLRVLGDGEFVPQAAIGEVAALEQRPVAVPVGVDLSAVVAVGSVVDLWFVPEATKASQVSTSDSTQQEPEEEPYALAQSLVVTEVNTDGSSLVTGSGTTVHVLVPQDDLAQVLGALAADGTVSLVPAFGGSQ